MRYSINKKYKKYYMKLTKNNKHGDITLTGYSVFVTKKVTKTSD